MFARFVIELLLTSLLLLCAGWAVEFVRGISLNRRRPHRSTHEWWLREPRTPLFHSGERVSAR